MKRLMAVLLLVLALGIISGCAPKGPKTERTARRIERRNRAMSRDLEAIPEDIETFWLYDHPGHLNRWLVH